MPFYCSPLAALGLCCLSVAGSLGPLGAEEVERAPNVILVITDDQGYGDVGAHGNTMIRTPTLDRLHAESVRFTDFHVDPTCSPTRAALMTGRYSTRTGVWHTILGRSLLAPGEVTLAEVFSEAGYRTAMVGKWHLGDTYPLRPQDQGFDSSFHHRGGGVGQGPDYWGNDYDDDTYYRDGVPEKVSGYCTDVWFDEAIRVVEEWKARPFFLYLSTNAPHGPYTVDESWSDPYEEAGVGPTMARFYGMITNIDANVARLLAKLDELELARDTIFVFMTDNGSAAGWRAGDRDARWKGFNAGMRGGKGSEYDGGHRVPCFVRWPGGGVGGGRDIDAPSAHVDLLPTLAELCGAPLPATRPLDGAGFSEALRGSSGAPEGRTLFVHSQRILHPRKWRKSAVLTDRWRLVNGRELYDIDEDPAQSSDIAGDHPDVVAELRSKYDAWWASLEEAFDDYVRTVIGSEAAPLVRLQAHDWLSEGSSPWHQSHIRRGVIQNGRWAIDVARGGKYEIALRRWPAERGGAIEAKEAKLRVGSLETARDVSPETEEVVFEVELDPGPAFLSSTLVLPDGRERGAYYAYVRRLDD